MKSMFEFLKNIFNKRKNYNYGNIIISQKLYDAYNEMKEKLDKINNIKINDKKDVENLSEYLKNIYQIEYEVSNYLSSVLNSISKNEEINYKSLDKFLKKNLKNYNKSLKNSYNLIRKIYKKRIKIKNNIKRIKNLLKKYKKLKEEEII
jgi:DNA repair ATPase RecN